MSWLKERMDAGARVQAQEVRRRTAARHDRLRSLEELSDHDLIYQSESRSTFSFPHHEMELQRRLKVAIAELTDETRKARIWAAWGAAVLAILTAVLIVLTVVLALKK